MTDKANCYVMMHILQPGSMQTCEHEHVVRCVKVMINTQHQPLLIERHQRLHLRDGICKHQTWYCCSHQDSIESTTIASHCA